MVRKTVDVLIDRPIEDVFEYASDADRLAEWNGPIAAARWTSDPPIGIGSTYTVDAEMPLGRIQTVEAEVTEFDRPTRICIETRSGMHYRSCREFESVDGKTRVTETLEAEPKFPARLAVSPMVRWFARTQGKNLRLLKERLERVPTTA